MLKAYKITAHDVTAYIAAPTGPRARTFCAREVVDAGYAHTMIDAYSSIRCKRVPEKDAEARSNGKEGWLNGHHEEQNA